MPPSTVPDEALIEQYLQHLQASKGRAPRTVEAYGLAIERLRDFLGAARPLLSATPDELEAFCGIWLHKRGVVARSRKPYISAVRGFYAWAASHGLVATDPALQLVHPKTGKPLPQALSLASAEKLMWAPDLNTFIGIRDAAMLGLLLGCGVRVGGLVGLNLGDLRNQEVDGSVRLVINVTEKGDKERILPVPREAEMLLRVYIDHPDLQGYDRDVLDRKGRPDKVLFVNTRTAAVPPDQWRGEAVRLSRHAVWRQIQRHGLRAGVPAEERHPHALRHLFGVELAEDDVDLITRGDLLGHADPRTTAVYTTMSIRRKVRVMDKSSPLAKMRSPVSEILKRM